MEVEVGGSSSLTSVVLGAQMVSKRRRGPSVREDNNQAQEQINYAASFNETSLRVTSLILISREL